jgi:hypothetical protein
MFVESHVSSPNQHQHFRQPTSDERPRPTHREQPENAHDLIGMHPIHLPHRIPVMTTPHPTLTTTEGVHLVPDQHPRREKSTPHQPQQPTSKPAAATDVPIITRSLIKIDEKVIGTFDPASNTTHGFCARLRRLRRLYRDVDIVAKIPNALRGRAKLWFDTAALDSDNMATVEGRIELMSSTFKVHVAVARRQTRKRRYNPTYDKSVQDYIFEKVDLIRGTQPEISDRDLLVEIWTGLPAGYQMILDEY